MTASSSHRRSRSLSSSHHRHNHRPHSSSQRSSPAPQHPHRQPHHNNNNNNNNRRHRSNRSPAKNSHSRAPSSASSSRKSSSRSRSANPQSNPSHQQAIQNLKNTDISLLRQQLQWDQLPTADGPKTLFIGAVPVTITTEQEFMQHFVIGPLAELNRSRRDSHHAPHHNNTQQNTPQRHSQPTKWKFLDQSGIGFVTFEEHRDAKALLDFLAERKHRALRRQSSSQRQRNRFKDQDANNDPDSIHDFTSYRVNWSTNMDALAKGRGFYLTVRNLPPPVTDRMLERLFQLRYGEAVTKAKVVVEQDSGHSRGHGWVAFSDPKVRQQAFQEMHREFLGSKRIRVAIVLRRGTEFQEHEDDKQLEAADMAEEKEFILERRNRCICIEGLAHDLKDNDIKGEILRHVPVEVRQKLGRGQIVLEQYGRSEDGLMVFARLPTRELAEHMVNRINCSEFLGCFVKVHITNMATVRYQMHAEKQWRQYFVSIHQQKLTLRRLFEKQQPENFKDNLLRGYNIGRGNAQYAESDLGGFTVLEMEGSEVY